MSLSPTGTLPSGIYVGSIAMPKFVEATPVPSSVGSSASEPSDSSSGASSASSASSDGDTQNSEDSGTAPTTLLSSTTSSTTTATDTSAPTFPTGATVLRARDSKKSVAGSTFDQINSAAIYMLALGISAFIFF